MSYKYTAQAITGASVSIEGVILTRGTLTHAVIASSWRGTSPIDYTFSLEAAQAIADAFNALENMDEEFLKEEPWCPGDKLGGACPGIESGVNSDCPKWKEEA